MEIIKVIRITYLLNKKKEESLVAHFVYGREVNQTYDVKSGDIFDRKLLEFLSENPTLEITTGPEIVYEQEFDEDDFIQRFDKLIRRTTTIFVVPRIFTSDAQTNLMFNQVDTSRRTFTAYWLLSKNQVDSYFSFLPRIDFDMEFRELQRIQETIIPILSN
ncbi:hypothetical protein DMZ43_05625 [Meridianimaribacter sp. CL38]|uniref:hypothetical protein n=1 Tax=Meridianimaribacter sp. CL38 TaxID=2213021 RepID=UPI00103F1512|nr:hypothetical protein [Meridianimaribacter sp. CL38]TBV26546.1 hypothetical protein DMZ43_05625 [Meridianimaribacter sp. CL38]